MKLTRESRKKYKINWETCVPAFVCVTLKEKAGAGAVVELLYYGCNKNVWK